MTERKRFGFKLPSILPQEGYSVLKPLFEGLERENKVRKPENTGTVVLHKPMEETSKFPNQTPNSAI